MAGRRYQLFTLARRREATKSHGGVLVAASPDIENVGGINVQAWTRIVMILSLTLYLLHGGDLASLGVLPL